ncbi:MAG: DNA-binding NtrC family response regulator [Myxococcota bacterium]
MSRLQLRILVVDDNQSSAKALARLLRRSGDQVDAVFDGRSAIAAIEQDPPDVVLTDLRMEPVNGLQVLQAARAARPAPAVIVFTAHGEVDTAVRAMRLGALDFLTKPVTLEQLHARLDRIRGVDDESAPADFVAVAESSRVLVRVLKRAAAVPSPVWIEGEFGTGRTFCARTIHQLSQGSGRPIRVCDPGAEGAWPDTGTVVLPEVDQLDETAQWRLVRRLHAAPPGLRLVGTAQPGAQRKVSEERLLSELFYRMAVVVVSVPPLQERSDDIVPLFRGALARFANRYALPVPDMTAAMEAQLLRHAWPGNVRELLNLAERTVVLGAEAFALVVHERPMVGMPVLEEGFSLARHLEEIEKRILREALRKAGKDRNKAGRLLSLERNTLRYKLRKYELL